METVKNLLKSFKRNQFNDIDSKIEMIKRISLKKEIDKYQSTDI
jgi:hypothetical protein